MRGIPLDSDLVERLGGGERRVLAAPDGDLTSTTCAPLEVLLQTDTAGDLVTTSAWALTPEELAALNAGAPLRLHLWGWQLPVALGVVGLDVE